jgi:hypothetical protein
LHDLLRTATRSLAGTLDEAARTPDLARFTSRLTARRHDNRKTAAVVLSLVVVAALAATIAVSR